MQKKHRLIIALILLLAAAAGALADASEGVYCGDLAQADCQILLENADLMNALNSLAFDASMDMRLDGAEPMRLAGRVHGAFGFDDESLRALEDMSAQMSIADLTALVDLALTSAKARLSIEMSGAAVEDSFDLDLDLLLQDGVLLLGAEALEAMTGESMEGLAGIGVDLNGAIDLVLAEAGDLSMLDESAPMTDESAMQAIEAEAEAAMSVRRLADSEVNGVAVAVFETVIDVNALLSMPLVAQMVATSGGLENAQSIDETLNSIHFANMSSREYIGLQDRYTYRIDMTMDMTMTLAEGDQALDGALALDMLVDLSGFDQPVELSMPEDVFVIPLAMMMQMSEQGS